MPVTTVGWWTGRRPPKGVYDKRDNRFTPDGYCEIANNMELHTGALGRRRGYRRRNTGSRNSNTCYHHNGIDQYIAIPDHSSLALGTSWCVEIIVEFLDSMPTEDKAILIKGNNSDFSIFFYYHQAVGKFKTYFETASENVTLASTTTPTFGTKYTLSLDRDGDNVALYINGGAAEDTHVMTTGSGEPNKTTTARLLLMARANNAAGNIPDTQFLKGKWAHARWWSAARGQSSINSNHARELPYTDTTNLEHYWRGYAGANRSIVYDSVDHIALADRLNGFALPTGRPTVGRYYPENKAAWHHGNPGIMDGDSWALFDGVEMSDAKTPNTHQEQVFNVQIDSKYQWCVRGEFIPRAVGKVQTIMDWTAGTGKHLMVEILAGNTVRAESRWGGSQRLVTTTGVVAAGVPYVFHVCRNGADFRIRIHRKTDDAEIDDTTSATGSTATGEASAGNDLTRGSTTAGANYFDGAIGPITVYDEADGPLSIPKPSVLRANHARLHISGRAVGRGLKDMADDSDTAGVVPSYVDRDEHDSDGPPLGGCITGMSLIRRGFPSFITGYNRASRGAENPGEIERFVLMGFGGSIWRAPNYEYGTSGWAPFVFEEIYKGRKVTRTTLSCLARYKDDIAIFDGINRNLHYNRKDEITKLGLDKPATACTAALGINGNLIDGATYDYYIVYRDPQTGHRSSRSPVRSWTISGSGFNKKIELTNIPTCSDPTRGVVWRDIYRTKWGVGGKSEHVYLIATLKDNTTTTYSDNIADTTLTAASRLDTEDGFDVGDVAPVCRYGIVYQSRLWVFGDPSDPTRVRYSRIGNIQGFTAHGSLDLSDYGTGDPLTGGAVLYDRLFLFTENSIWEVKARGAPETFALDRVCDYVGAAGHWGIVKAVVGPFQTLLFWNAGDQRLYAFDGSGGPTDVSDNIDGTIATYNQRVMPYAVGTFYNKNSVAMWALSTGDVDNTLEGDAGYPENDVFLFAWVGVAMSQQGLQWQIQFTTGGIADVNCLGTIEDPVTRENKPFAVDYRGYIREYDYGDMDGDDFPSSGTDILYGLTGSGCSSTLLYLKNQKGNAFNTWNYGDSGAQGLWLTIVKADGTEESRRIDNNTDTGVTQVEEAFSFTPAEGLVWRIGQIAGKVKLPDLDFQTNQTKKALYWFTLFHRLEDGRTQASEATSRISVECYQDGASTSLPASRIIDTSVASPLTNPDARVKRVEVGQTGALHSIQLYGPWPNEPFQIEGLNFDVDAFGIDVAGGD